MNIIYLKTRQSGRYAEIYPTLQFSKADGPHVLFLEKKTVFKYALGNLVRVPNFRSPPFFVGSGDEI